MCQTAPSNFFWYRLRPHVFLFWDEVLVKETEDSTELGLVNIINVFVHTLGGACGVMVIVVGNEHETDCISHSTNTHGKGMNPIILPPAMGK